MLRQVKAVPVLSLALALLALGAGCARVAERAGAPAVVPADAAAAAPAATAVRTLRIEPARSLLTIQAWRGGALAAAGHNHVIAARDLEGEVAIAEPLAASRLRLRFPVARLTIDEPALRARAGEDFAAEVPDAARDGTRRNLLGGALLDAERFPWIELQSSAVAPLERGARLTLRARVRDHESSFEVPVALEWRGAELVARGAVELRQSQLGLVPFSVMMGALQVQDTLRLQFEVVAAP